MYMDRHLEYERVGKDAAAATTRSIPLAQSDLVPMDNAGTTADVSPLGSFFFMVIAGSTPIPAGTTVELQHSDTQTGTYTTLAAYGPSAAITNPGEIMVSAPCPQGAKAWTRVVKSSATAMNIFFTYDVVPKSLPTFPR